MEQAGLTDVRTVGMVENMISAAVAIFETTVFVRVIRLFSPYLVISYFKQGSISMDW